MEDKGEERSEGNDFPHFTALDVSWEKVGTRVERSVVWVEREMWRNTALHLQQSLIKNYNEKL